MGRKVILHIGVHKTGSTAIQNACLKNRKSLNEIGWHYPEELLFNEAHHILPWSVIDRFLNDPIANTRRLSKERLKDILFKYGNIVISSENFCFAKDNEVREIAELFEDFETIVVVFIRRQDRLLQSEYVQRVKQEVSSELRPFEEFCRLWQFLLPHIDYLTLINRWSSHFDNIVVRNFDVEAEKDEVISSFFSSFVDNTDKIDTDQAAENVAYGLKYISLLRELNNLEILTPGIRRLVVSAGSEFLPNSNKVDERHSFYRGDSAKITYAQFRPGNIKLWNKFKFMKSVDEFPDKFDYIGSNDFVETNGYKYLDDILKLLRKP